MCKKILCLLLCIPIILTTGCWDSKDINEKSIAIAIGVDYVDNLLEFSGEIVKLTSTKEGDGKSEASGVYSLNGSGKTFEEARFNYNSSIPFDSFLGATRVVILGENYAKQGIEAYLNRIDSLYDYRKTLLPAISREPVKELFNTKTDKDISVGFLVDNILNHLREDGQAICPNIGDLLSDIAFNSIGYVIPYVGKEFDEIKYLGLGVFKDSILIDIINIKDTKPLIYVLANNPKIIELISDSMDDENNYSFRVTINKRNIVTAYENDTVVININIDLDAELRYQYYINQITQDMIKNFEEELSLKISNDIFDMVKKAQKEFRCDIFKFGKKFKSQHYKLSKEMDWEDAFLTAKINVNVKTKIINKNLKSANKKE